MRSFAVFLRDEAGAITIDWVSLTAGVLVLAIIVVFSIFNTGVMPLVSNTNANVTSAILSVETGTIDTSKL